MNDTHKNNLICILFSLFLGGAFLACLLLPKPSYSDTERRPLAAMPEFSAKTVADGRFMKGFEAYAQDSFPLRDQFRSLKALTAAGIFQKKDNNGIYVSQGYAAAMEYPMDQASLERAASRFRYLYDTCLDQSNRVFLSVIPDKNCFLAGESGRLSMDYAALEREMERLTGDFARYLPISHLLSKEDYYHTDTHWRQERITDVAQCLLEGMRGGMEERNNEAEEMSGRTEDGQDKTGEKNGGTDELRGETGEKNDGTEERPGETGEKNDGAEERPGGAKAGQEPLSPQYTPVTATENFRGVYYGQSALPLAPEPLVYLDSSAIQACRVHDWQNGREIPMYDRQRAEGKDPYELFLSGPLSLITIQNPQAKTDRRLVLFRDSFGSSIAPLLIEDYAQITLVDIRYIQPGFLNSMVDFEGCDVLFLYSTLVLNHSETLK